MSVKIFVAASSHSVNDYCIEELAKRGQVSLKRELDKADPKILRQAQAEADIVVVSGGTKFPSSEYPFYPKARLIADFGVGYDGIDIKEANRRKILVSHTPNVLNDDVADLAMAFTLNITRDLVQSHIYAAQGRWETDGTYPLQTAVNGLKCGIAGMGRIGLEIAARAKAFKMEVGYLARNKKDLPYAYFDNILDLAAFADVLILVVPSTAQTRHLVNKQVLEALGPHGYLVNIARGSVVDTQALIEALQNETIAGAALDVFDDEPRIPDYFRHSPKVIVAPHVGSATDKTRKAMADLLLSNVDAYLQGKPLVTQVPENKF